MDAPLFEARIRAGVDRIQFALAGMNAHINRFSVLYGNGDSSFRAPVAIVPETMSAGFGAATDFNLDGARDLAVVTYANGSTTIRFGDGMNHLVLGDFNGGARKQSGVILRLPEADLPALRR